jgi:hypothetical protein
MVVTSMNRTELRYIAVASFALAAALVALPASAAGSSIGHHSVHAGTARQAVKMVLRPYEPRNNGTYNFSNCTAVSPRLHPDLTCPETPRLLHYLAVRQLPRSDSGLPFCRCQSGVYAVRVMPVQFNNGHVARVDARWDFGPAGATPSHTYATDTFVVLRQAGGWLVDDEYCAGRPATSVYRGIAGQSPCYRR